MDCNEHEFPFFISAMTDIETPDQATDDVVHDNSGQACSWDLDSEASGGNGFGSGLPGGTVSEVHGGTDM